MRKIPAVSLPLVCVFFFSSCASSVTVGNSADTSAEIRKALGENAYKITVNYRSHGDNMDGLSDVVKGLWEEALDETENPTEGDYLRTRLGGYEISYGYEQKLFNYDYEIEIYPVYYTTVDEEAETLEKADEIVSQISGSDYEKIFAVYNWMCENIKYDKVHAKNDYYHLKATAYGALVNGAAICQGYAAAMYLLLRLLDVNCRIVTGTAPDLETGEEVLHAWNIVELDGRYYNVDVMWDVQTDTHDYFLKCDENFDYHTREGDAPSGCKMAGEDYEWEE